jgi:hypothetical protein
MSTPIARAPISPVGSYSTRWETLLAEHSILHKDHLDLLSSFTVPFSARQVEQALASAARFGELPPKIRQLVEDWAKSQSV